MNKAIVVVSFGVGNPQAKISCIDALMGDVKSAFGEEYAVHEAWTCNFLRKKMAKAGVIYSSLEEKLTELAEAGCDTVVIMPSHLTPGEEFQHKILPAAEAFAAKFQQIQVMQPIFTGSTPADFAFLGQTGTALGMDELRPDEAMVLMGHGSPHQHNAAYELLQQYADTHGWRVHIGVVEQEDFPNQQDVLRRLQEQGVKKVFLRPLLLAGGTHATEDLAGDQPDSWKNTLQAAGYQVRCSVQGLGELPAFRGIYLNCLKKIIN